MTRLSRRRISTLTEATVLAAAGARGRGLPSLTSSPVRVNTAGVNSRGVYRSDGTMTITTSPLSGNLANNCEGGSPAVPNCTA